jgi:hypothetical protein
VGQRIITVEELTRLTVIIADHPRLASDPSEKGHEGTWTAISVPARRSAGRPKGHASFRRAAAGCYRSQHPTPPTAAREGRIAEPLVGGCRQINCILPSYRAARPSNQIAKSR